MQMLCADIGTTLAKVQVFNETGDILFYEARPTPLCRRDGEMYADIDCIRRTVRDLIRAATAAVGPVTSVAFSSFGEAFVLLDRADRVLSYPMLYTDTRGADCAAELSAAVGDERYFAITGTMPHAMYSCPKAMWLKKHRPDLFAAADKLCLIGDYFGYLLSGRRTIDYALAARTGAFDIREKVFSADILRAAGLSPALFSEPRPAGTVVGPVLPDVAADLGLPGDCVLVLGSHDQVCATVGAGVLSDGEAADGMGTVECITAVFRDPDTPPAFGRMGYCTVPFPGGLYCTYILNYTSGSVVNWYRNELLHNYTGGAPDVFTYLARDEAPTDVLVLPYFAGCATPYQDGRAKGMILNLTTATTDAQIFRAILEGTSYEMKLNLEKTAAYGIRVRAVTATGGGANSALWLGIKSDVLGVPVRTLRSSEGGLAGLAMFSAAALGLVPSLAAGRDRFVRYGETVTPSGRYDDVYRQKYEQYKTLYFLGKEVN